MATHSKKKVHDFLWQTFKRKSAEKTHPVSLKESKNIGPLPTPKLGHHHKFESSEHFAVFTEAQSCRQNLSQGLV